MFNQNNFRKLLESGKATLGTRLLSTWPYVTEAVGATKKYDYIEFTAEYAPYDQYDMENICRAAELHGMTSMIKVDYQNRAFAAQKGIASGFEAVLFTDHIKPEEVEESIRLILPKCPQKDGCLGFINRRWNGFQKVVSQDEYIELSSAIVKAFMVEKKETVENLDEFLSVPGIDMVQFGPNDFALSSGFNMKDNMDKVRAAEKKVIEACHKHHIRPRCELNSADDGQFYMDLGVKDFSLGLEMRILQNFLTNEGDALLNLMAKNGIIK